MWVDKPGKKSDAFARGVGIIGIIAATFQLPATEKVNSTDPNNFLDESNNTTNKTEAVDTYSSPDEVQFLNANYIETEFQADNNATIIDNNWISSCAPSYSGFLGLGSFFTKKINVRRNGDSLASGERIKVLGRWETNWSGFRYLKIQYDRNGLKTGWIYVGKEAYNGIQIDSGVEIPEIKRQKSEKCR